VVFTVQMSLEQTKIVRNVKLFPSRREGATVARKIFLHSVGKLYQLPCSSWEKNLTGNSYVGSITPMNNKEC
jgi:hypothetical protein